MNEESSEHLEQQLARIQPSGVPQELRATVMMAVHRQLIAQRWDRRLVRVAAALLVTGIALNWTVILRDGTGLHGQIGDGQKPEAIVEVAVAVAQATDVQTATSFAQHLAALNGASLSPQQSAAMQQEIQRRVRSSALGRKEG